MTLRETLTAMVVVSVAATVVAAQALDGPGQEATAAGPSAADFRWSGTVPEGETVEIKGINGAVRAVRAAGDEVVVTTEARGRRADPSSVRIERVEHAGGLTFCAVYPTPEGKAENRCAPGSDGRMNTDRNDVRVDFRVELPDGVHFVGRTVNGSVEASGVGGDVHGATVNGDVEIATSGFASAETVNGSIEATMGGDGALRRGAEFSTVNGSVVLDLPDDVDAELHARWMNGSFESDIPFLLQGQVSKRSAEGVLGDGGPRLAVKTVNGSIRIR